MSRRGFLLLVAAIALSPSGARAQDYFPLHFGNQWIYRETGLGASPPIVVEITRTETANGIHYSVLRGLGGGEVWLRQDDKGTLYAYDPGTGAEDVWAVFATPAGETYRTAINECNRTAKVESRTGRLRLPIGEVINALHVSYPGANCADAGLSSEYYLPYIGLVRREAITIAGPRVLELIYARVGGVTVLTQPELAFTVSTDRTVYAGRGAAMVVRMSLRSTLPEELKLTFGSGQRYEIVIRSEKGDEVYRWSTGKAFTLALVTETIFNREKSYVELIPLSLPAGTYVVEAHLATIGPKIYSGTVGFEIVAGV